MKVGATVGYNCMGIVRPATVTSVNMDGSCNLFVFLESGDMAFGFSDRDNELGRALLKGVGRGPAVGQWSDLS